MTQPKKSKWKYWFFGTLITLIVIYSAIWYFASQFIEDKFAQFLEREKQKNRIIACDSIDKSGYPLRVGISCSHFDFKYETAGIEVTTQTLKATAPIYALTWADVFISGPALIRAPGFLPIKANWKELELSFNVDKELPNKISFFGEDLNLTTSDDNGQDYPLLSTSFLRLDADGLRDNLTLQLAFDKLQLPLTLPKTNIPIPTIEGMIRLQLDDAYDVFGNRPSSLDVIKQRLYGHSGSIDRAEIALETGGEIIVSGPYSIDNSGYLNADFDIAVGDINAVTFSLKQLFPDQSKNIDTITFIVNTMPKNNNGEPLLKVTIKDGEAKLGYIKLGNINPL